MLWLKVTNDKYELPIAVGGTAQELADMLGITDNVIHSTISHYNKGRIKSCPYVKVEEGDDDALD